MALSTWLNNMIRMDIALSQPLALSNTPPTTRLEKEHFFEVQHIVALLMTSEGTVTEGNVFQIPIGFFIDLASCVSGQSNLFLIGKDENAAKRQISWAQYAPGARPSLLVNYLARGTLIQDGNGPPIAGPTVAVTVERLARAMATRRGEFSYLTRKVGQQICAHMNWLPEGRLLPTQHRQLGDWDVQTWQKETILNERDPRRGMHTGPA